MGKETKVSDNGLVMLCLSDVQFCALRGWIENLVFVLVYACGVAVSEEGFLECICNHCQFYFVYLSGLVSVNGLDEIFDRDT